MNNDISHHVYILIHTISFGSQPTMKVNIYNQCSDFELTNESYFRSRTNRDGDPGDKADTGCICVDFRPFLSIFDPSQTLEKILPMYEGGLKYELVRKHTKSGNQSASARILLFVAWKSEGYKNFRVLVQLIECENAFHWDETRLRMYYQRHINQLSTYTDPIKDTWLIHGDTVLVTELELEFTRRNGRLDLTISEGSKDEHAKRPEWIDPNR
jgi:hypothetical protein